MRNSILVSGVALCALAIVSYLTGAAVATPPSQPVKIRDLRTNPHLDDTMEKAEALLAQLQSNGWNWRATDRRLWRVADQDHAQFPDLRDPRRQTFMPGNGIYADKVAFYTGLYRHRDFQVVPGKEGKVTWTGFFLVAYKDGQIKQVPVSDVRMLTNGDVAHCVFPGMKEYSTELRPFDVSPDDWAASKKPSAAKA